MAFGDPANVAIEGDADMFVAFDLDAAVPADETTDFSADWFPMGILNGDKGIAEGRDSDETKVNGWGWGTVRTAFSNFATTWKWTAIEQNAVVWRLVNPNSTPPAISANGQPERVKLAYEVRDGETVKRKIVNGYALVKQDGEINITEKGAIETPFLAAIYPDDDRELFTEQPTIELGDVAPDTGS